jgi:hypothetical protein
MHFIFLFFAPFLFVRLVPLWHLCIKLLPINDFRSSTTIIPKISVMASGDHYADDYSVAVVAAHF